MNCHANKCIECTVKQCAYHCDTENYCSLDRILVGTHEAAPLRISAPTASPSARSDTRKYGGICRRIFLLTKF